MKELSQLILSVLLLLMTSGSFSSAQYFSTYSPGDDQFNRKIKIIDEFIDRFNGKDSSLFKLVPKNNQYLYSRGRQLVSLFDLENTTFTDKNSALKTFFDQVLDKAHPVYLSFNDTNWYAEARAIFILNGKLVEIPLILNVKSHGDEWSKWMIAGVGDAVISNEPMPSVSDKMKGSPVQYISSSAYAMNFVELHNVFTTRMQPENFFDPATWNTNKVRLFVSYIKNGQLKFQYVKKISFHFYQVNGWILKVEQFNRKSINSGWLISAAQKVTIAEKEAAKKKLLFR
jgi:hypothetical protein